MLLNFRRSLWEFWNNLFGGKIRREDADGGETRPIGARRHVLRNSPIHLPQAQPSVSTRRAWCDTRSKPLKLGLGTTAIRAVSNRLRTNSPDFSVSDHSILARHNSTACRPLLPGCIRLRHIARGECGMLVAFVAGFANPGRRCEEQRDGMIHAGGTHFESIIMILRGRLLSA